MNQPALQQQNQQQQQQPVQLEISGSRQVTSWMIEQRVSLGFSTYQTGKMFLIGIQPDGRMSIFERTFNRAMGMWASQQTILLSSLYQLWRFENVVQPGQHHNGYDKMFVPTVGFNTADIDIHDVVMDKNGEIFFVNTLFGCLAKPSFTHSFEPVWKPPFISKLAAEDRCHMNGLAMKDGSPKYVSIVGKSDVADGWRDHRSDGGLIVDVETNEIVATGMSMPHSPRWYNGTLYILNSGTGEFGKIDLERGTFEPIAFCPGYLRGMAFHNNYAIVGTSKSRDNKTFSGLALDDKLAEKGSEAKCMLHIIDLNTGDIVHWIKMEGIVKELYDVVAMPGVVRPMAIGFKTDEIRRIINMSDSTI